MARKPIPKFAGTPLQPGWRPVSWQVPAMMSKIPQSEYEATWTAFEHASVGIVSADWPAQWRAYCHAEMMRRFGARKAAKEMFG